MLYFSHMKSPQPDASEAANSTSTSGVSQGASVLPEELATFGLFLSQILYMTSWIFPGNRLPDSIQAAAASLESEDNLTHELSLVEKRENVLS